VHGTVIQISSVDGYGFIQADDRRIYFSRASVLDDALDALAVGTPVAFTEEKGEKGPQASSVRPLGKHHYVTP
jgi:cold shock CspA family protein